MGISGHGRTTELTQLLRHAPQPLIDPRNRLVLIFSAKVASNSLAIWFWHHLGHLQAARDHSHAPHRYRTQVYYKSMLYRNACTADLSGFTVIRAVRDPYERVTSMYRHALRFGLADNMLERWSRWRGAATGFSFANFLGRLEKMDLSNCDVHFKIQRHPVEARLPADYVIDVSRENLFERLGEIESKIGLPRSDLAKSEWVQDRSKRHHRASEFPHDVYNHPFTPRETRGAWPRHEAFLTDDARQRIAKLYDADIRSYFQPPALDRVAA